MFSLVFIRFRLHLLVTLIIWLKGYAPALSFSTSNTFTIMQGGKRTENHHALFAISPQNKKLATSRIEAVDASLHASALLKEEQVTSSSQSNNVVMFDKAWTPVNNADSIEKNDDTTSFNIESDLMSQVLEYETLLERTQSQPHLEEVRDALLEPHSATSDEKNILNSAKEPVHIFEGRIVSYASNIAVEQIDQSKDAATGLSDVWTARILLIISAALYGTNFTVVKLLNDSVPTDVGAVLRFALAAGVTLPWLFNPSSEKKTTNDELEDSQAFHHLPIDKSRRRSLDMSFIDTPIFAGLEVGMWTAIGYLAQAEGLETIDAGKSAFICSLAVVTVPVLDFLAGKKILSRHVLGAILAVIGVGFLEMDGPVSAITESGGAFNLDTGDMLSLVQPLAFGLGFWRMEDAMRRFPEDAMKVTAAQLLAVFIMSVCYCGISAGGIDGLPDTSQIVSWITDPMILGALCWTGLITTAFTVYLETLALKTLSAAETTMIFSTEPLFGATFAAAVMGETFGQGGLIGGALILGGCIFSNLKLDSFHSDEI